MKIVRLVLGAEGINRLRWPRLVWQRAWTIEDAHWMSTNLIMQENDLLVGTMSQADYVVWGQLSDKYPEDHVR